MAAGRREKTSASRSPSKEDVRDRRVTYARTLGANDPGGQSRGRTFQAVEARDAQARRREPIALEEQTHDEHGWPGFTRQEEVDCPVVAGGHGSLERWPGDPGGASEGPVSAGDEEFSAGDQKRCNMPQGDLGGILRRFPSGVGRSDSASVSLADRELASGAQVTRPAFSMDPRVQFKQSSHEPELGPGILNQLWDVFNVRALRLKGVHNPTQSILQSSMSTLQMGTILGQLLLAQPRDGLFIKQLIQQTWTEKTNTPTRRDLLPFGFVPSVGAALKLMRMFPVNAEGMIQVKKESLSGVPRQQKKQLVLEGCMQLWRWLIMVVLSGEYLDWEIKVPLAPSQPSIAQAATMELITDAVRRFCGDPFGEFNFPDFSAVVRSKSLDYNGDEVSYALPLRLEELLPGLPSEDVGGSLDAMAVVDETVKAWLGDPAVTLKPVEQWPAAVPTAKINCSRAEWYRVVGELFRRNIVGPIDEKDIFSVGGVKVLNGAFAVAKSGTPLDGESRVCRLIMNMVPANRYQLLMRGDLQTLAGAPSWASLVLKDECTLLWSSDDQRGAFYAWRPPEVWRPYMCFRWPVPSRLVGRPGDALVYVSAQVVPMGWLNAVSLFQHLHRRLGMSNPPLGAGFAERLEWRRDRPVPQSSLDDKVAWVQYYLDDFDAPEVVDTADVSRLRNHFSPLQQRQREAYAAHGVGISPNKAVQRETKVIRMGAYVDGELGIVSAPPDKVKEVLGFTLWAMAQPKPSNKVLMMILGRMVRCFEFRRPLMSVLRNCWPRGHVHSRRPWTCDAFRSLLRACVMLPMGYSDLRSSVDPLVSASDASEDGGGLCVSGQLTDEGQTMLRALQSETYVATRCWPFGAAGEMPRVLSNGPKVFVLSLFDGIAAIMCALTRLPCQVVGFAASEIDKECKRLVRKRWPGVIELGGVELISDKTIEAIVTALGFEVDVILIAAGSPCQDLSRLLANRQGLQGSRSRLFFEIPRIYQMCLARFPGKVHLLVENVESMTNESKAQFSQTLGCKPLFIQAHQLTAVRRPRLYWCSWPVAPQANEQVVETEFVISWTFDLPGGVARDWVDDGWSRPCNEPLPTFTRALPRSAPPAKPAGYEHSSCAARTRWAADAHRFQVYQYEDNHLLWENVRWRLPSLQERERLMGFPVGYISKCLPSKLSDDAKFNLGCCMIGNTFHVPSVMMVCHSLLHFVFPATPPRDHLALLAPPPEAPEGWTKFPSFVGSHSPDPNCSQLIHEIMRQGDRGGTDVRLDVGIPFRFKAFPRAGLRTSFFAWRVVHGYKWRHTSHINCLELQGVINSLQWRLRKLGAHRKRVLHLVDSQLVASVIAKGRTSSFRLRKGIQKLNALLVASGIRFSVGYCHTSDNPADLPSRWASKKSAKKKGDAPGKMSPFDQH